MATVLVKVGHVSSHEPDEMAFAEDYNMLEELATAVSDPALSGSVFAKERRSVRL